jgi:hypothetical protein
MVNYITTIISDKYMSIGGFGHVFYDVLSSFIIAHLFNLKFVYSPIDSLNDNYHRKSGKKNPKKFGRIVWDDFLKFSNNELQIKDIKKLNLQEVKINLCKSFFSIKINKLEELFKNKDNTLFILTNNNRIYLNEIYHQKRNKYNIIIKKLKQKLVHLKENNKNINNKVISLHIRQGDWCNVPLVYYTNFLNLVDTSKYIINIFSVGNRKQMNNIRNIFSKYKDINYYLNTDVFDTFKKIYNSDIVVGGQSNFPKIITIFSNNIFIYLPYKDGECKSLGVNKKFKKYHLGNNLESFDEKNRIMTNLKITMNNKLILDNL